jgi:predicted anti-sigma-YlaC factor YlaD
MEHLDNSTLWQYVTDASGLTDKVRISDHLSNCEDCKREFELLKHIEEALRAAEEEVPSPGFSNAVVRKLETEAVREGKIRFSTTFFRYTVLGAFALAFLSAIIFALGLDIKVSYAEESLKGPFLLMLSASVILWGFYIVDRVCNKIFGQTEYSESF